jgi:tRNA A37 threonylcarbamoyladenosine biosynthesis protein TsaE
VHHVDLYRLGPGAALDVLDLDGALVEGAAVIEWAEYADLAGYAPVAMSIDLPGPAPEDRVLRLTGPAPAHILSAWVALS